MTREEKNEHVIAALRVTIERLQSSEGREGERKLRDQLHALALVADGRRKALEESVMPTRRRKPVQAFSG
jgi:hypothetical protein